MDNKKRTLSPFQYVAKAIRYKINMINFLSMFSVLSFLFLDYQVAGDKEWTKPLINMGFAGHFLHGSNQVCELASHGSKVVSHKYPNWVNFSFMCMLHKFLGGNLFKAAKLPCCSAWAFKPTLVSVPRPLLWESAVLLTQLSGATVWFVLRLRLRSIDIHHAFVDRTVLSWW